MEQDEKVCSHASGSVMSLKEQFTLKLVIIYSTPMSVEHFWSFRAKECCSIFLDNWSSWELI